MEWLQTLIATIVGAVLAWVIGELNRRAAKKDQDAQLRREKLEEIFSELAIVENQAHQIMLSTMQREHGLETSRPPRLDPSRLSALLSIYFPETRPLLEAHEQRLTDLRSRAMEEFKRAVRNGDPSTMRTGTLISTMETSEEYRRFGDELRKALKASAASLSVT